MPGVPRVPGAFGGGGGGGGRALPEVGVGAGDGATGWVAPGWFPEPGSDTVVGLGPIEHPATNGLGPCGLDTGQLGVGGR